MSFNMPESENRPEKALLSYFLLSFLFSWAAWLPAVLASFGLLVLPFPTMVLNILGAFGPLFAAVLLTVRREGWPGVKRLIASGFNLRLKVVWWLLILLLPFALTGLAVWINITLNQYQMDKTLINQPWMILPTFFIMFFFGGSFQEEFGWRGYALPRLLQRFNPAMASLILGVIWGVWHLPLFYISDTGQSFMPFGMFILMATSFSILFTWVYLKTERNLFSALLLHTAINTALSVFPPIEKAAGGNQRAFTYMTLAYLVIGFAIVISNRKLFFKRVGSIHLN